MYQRPLRLTGFTLIEILVVVLVISILMGVVVNSFTGADREQTLRGYAERLALRIEMARDKALQANREWGVYIDRESVRFAEFDEINGEWLERTQRPFAPEKYDSQVRIEVEIEDYPDLSAFANEGSNDDEELPTIVLFSSGETTPFEISIEPLDWDTEPWHLVSDGFTRVAVSRGEDAEGAAG
jgi:general secretion pathway protein H